MSGEGSLIYWFRDTSHSSSHHRNDGGIFDDESIGVSVGNGRRGHRSLDNTQSSSRNFRVYHNSDNVRGGYRSQYTRHYLSRNNGVYNFGFYGRGGIRSKETNHSYPHNIVAIVDVDSRVGYRSHTSHSSSHNPYGCGILLSLSLSSYPVD